MLLRTANMERVYTPCSPGGSVVENHLRQEALHLGMDLLFRHSLPEDKQTPGPKPCPCACCAGCWGLDWWFGVRYQIQFPPIHTTQLWVRFDLGRGMVMVGYSTINSWPHLLPPLEDRNELLRGTFFKKNKKGVQVMAERRCKMMVSGSPNTLQATLV